MEGEKVATRVVESRPSGGADVDGRNSQRHTGDVQDYYRYCVNILQSNFFTFSICLCCIVRSFLQKLS